jgi:hypothetical protein
MPMAVWQLVPRDTCTVPMEEISRRGAYCGWLRCRVLEDDTRSSLMRRPTCKTRDDFIWTEPFLSALRATFLPIWSESFLFFFPFDTHCTGWLGLLFSIQHSKGISACASRPWRRWATLSQWAAHIHLTPKPSAPSGKPLSKLSSP